MSAPTSAWDMFWNDPLGGLKTILASDGYDAQGNYFSLDGSGAPIGDSIGQAAVRARGVDPATGQLIPGIVAPRGYDPSNPGDFVKRTSEDATAAFISGYNANVASIPLLPTALTSWLPDFTLPDGSFDWANIAIAAVIALVVLIVIVKVL